MLRQIASIFHRYASIHGRVKRPGFPLVDSGGNTFGYVDRVEISRGELSVVGWTSGEWVGLTSDGATARKTPDLLRHDVLSHLRIPEEKPLGFRISSASAREGGVFWAEIAGERAVFVLPEVTVRELRRMKLRQIPAFARASLRIAPFALRWLLRRDPAALPAIKTILGFNHVPRSRKLDSSIFDKTLPGSDSDHAISCQTPVFIVLPVYNALDLLPETLGRILNHTDVPWQLTIIEDCSTDADVRPWLRNWHQGLEREIRDRVTIIENEQNRGFIGSVNTGLESALEAGHHVVLLNSDAFVPAGWASRLIRPLVEHDDVATVTPMSNDAEIFNVPVICRRLDLLPSEADALDRVAQRFRYDASLAQAPTGVGFCMAIGIGFLRKVGPLDTVFGRGYGEEVDWCQRARSLGGRHIGHAGVFVEHRGGTSFGSDEKLRLIRNNSSIISGRYPDYDQDVQDFIRHDPLMTPRLALALAWVACRQRGAVPVYVAHDMGGGAEMYLQRRIEGDLAADAASIVLRIGGNSRWQMELHTANGVSRGETDDAALLRQLLHLLPACRIVYSCGVGDRDPVALPDILLSLARKPQDRIEVLFHDFLPISPSYTLLGQDGVYRGVPDPETNDDPAHRSRRPDGTTVTLREWQSAWGQLLEAADRVEVFSGNSRDLVAQAYPQLSDRIVVNPHGILADVPVVEPGEGWKGKPVIGVLGNIGLHKGAAVLRDLSAELARSGAARLVVIGNVDPAYPLAPPALIHGDYRIGEIADLVRRYGISCWLIPSVWPETFSYTTHEALATGLPVWSFALGAQGDAIAAASAEKGRGGVIPLSEGEFDAARIMAYFPSSGVNGGTDSNKGMGKE